MARATLVGEIGRGLGGFAEVLRQRERDELERMWREAQLENLRAARDLERERLNLSREELRLRMEERERKLREQQEAESALTEAAGQMEQLYGVPSNVFIKLTKASPSLAGQILLHRMTEPEASYHAIEGTLIKIPKRGGEPQVVYKGVSPLERQAALQAAIEARQARIEESKPVPVYDIVEGRTKFIPRRDITDPRYAPIPERQAEDKTNIIKQIVSDPLQLRMLMDNPDAFKRLYRLSDEDISAIREIASGIFTKNKQPTQGEVGRPAGPTDEDLVRATRVTQPMPPPPEEQPFQPTWPVEDPELAEDMKRRARILIYGADR